jgi:hypothetical protein
VITAPVASLADHDHIENVTRKLAIAKLALLRILIPKGDVGAMIAAQALENMRDD